MRDGWQRRWGWRASAVVLVGGVLALGTGTVITQAGERDNDHNQRNPFQQILHKLDKILDAVKGGGGQDGNHTLRWDQALPAAQRFMVLATFNDTAVLDRETGLVWEKAPSTELLNWIESRNTCINRNVGGRKGWRLPSVAELSSMVDPANINPALPTGHPFTIDTLPNYWSASTDAENTTTAWNVDLGFGILFKNEKTFFNGRAWCVRGGMTAAVY